MKHYVDMIKENKCIGILFDDPEDTVVFTGTRFHTEPAKYRGIELEQRLAQECDLHFWFDDEKLAAALYTVPQVEIGGYDSRGGLFAGCDRFTLREPEPMYYISPEGKCYLITPDSSQFMGMGVGWRETMVPTDAIEVFASREEAEQKYEIKELKDLFGEELWNNISKQSAES